MIDDTRDIPGDAEAPTGSLTPRQDPDPAPTRVGRYRVLEALGEGGFGVVYRAEQSEPVRRQVALKVIKPGMDSRAVVSRFEAERQALALMAHPCVAKVLDGGTTDEGRPYFAMDLVKGEPITEHCDRQKLGVRARIELFIRVCEAVQHAHHKGVVHRDLKPSNVLIEYEDGKPTPKVIDFGVAKALHQPLTEATIFTGQGQMIGTPEYMSPEQAEMSGTDIDTRSDVYSLGVLLYELLTGSRPFDSEQFRKAALFEIQRIIREVDPPKPSTRLSTAAEAESAADSRATEVRSLSGVLRRDLDWVCMKCLEKDRERRYDTANALAVDLRRFLSDQPIIAGPPSATYRLSKFVRRNRAGVVAASVVAAALLTGLGGTTWGLLEANEQRRLAVLAQRREAAQRMDAEAARTAIRSRDNLLEDKPLMQTAVLQKLADIKFADGWNELDALDEIIGAQEEVLTIRRVQLGNKHLDTLASINNMGALLKFQGRLPEAEPYFREALETSRRVLGDEHPETLNSIGNTAALLESQGKLTEALELLVPGVRTAEASLPERHPLIPALREKVARVARALHEDEPDAGYDAMAEEWEAKLEQPEPDGPDD